MLGHEKLEQLAEIALGHSKADQTEIVLRGTDTALSRFANNAIHQNIFESNVTARVRVILGKRTGVAESNDISPEGIKRAVDMARAIAQLQPENPQNARLPQPRAPQQIDAYATNTADCAPETRARVIEQICRPAAAQKWIAAGAFRTQAYELAVVTSLGTRVYHRGTRADLSAVIMNDAGTASGFASTASPDAREIDARAVAQRALDKAQRSLNPIALAPGEYTVVLEPEAVASALQYTAWHTFNALAVQEERSFVRGRRGEALFSPLVSVYDDGTDRAGFPLPFDYEGVPRQRVTFIAQGVAREVVYDTFTAQRDNVASTGHALPAPNLTGPLPQHLFLAPGAASQAELVAQVTRGILVTRFWYTRVVHPLHVMMTGLTRDGTFLIENGQVTLPVKNLRFTSSYLDIFKNTRAVGRETHLMYDERTEMSFCAPALVVDGFNFTGVTQ